MKYCTCEFWKTLAIALIVIVLGLCWMIRNAPPFCREIRVEQTVFETLASDPSRLLGKGENL